MNFGAILLFVSILTRSITTLNRPLQSLSIVDCGGWRCFFTNGSTDKCTKIVDKIVEAICFDPPMGLLENRINADLLEDLLE